MCAESMEKYPVQWVDSRSEGADGKCLKNKTHSLFAKKTQADKMALVDSNDFCNR